MDKQAVLNFLQGHEQNEKPLPITYEIRKGISVVCLLAFEKVYLNTKFDATVGIKRYGDTRLPLGTKIRMFEVRPQGDKLITYETEVIQIDRVEDKDVHKFAKIRDLQPDDKDKLPKGDYDVRIIRENGLTEDAVLTLDSLKLIIHSSLTGVTIGSTLNIWFEGADELPYECEVMEMTYNWWENRHTVRVEFANLKAKQKAHLDQLVHPQVFRYFKPIIDEHGKVVGSTSSGPMIEAKR